MVLVWCLNSLSKRPAITPLPERVGAHCQVFEFLRFMRWCERRVAEVK